MLVRLVIIGLCIPLAPRSLAQSGLAARELKSGEYLVEPGEHVRSSTLVDYFPDGDRLFHTSEVRLLEDEEGRSVADAQVCYQRETPGGQRRPLLVLHGRRTFGADDEYGGWSPAALESVSPAGQWALGVRLRYWREDGRHHRTSQHALYNWQTGEMRVLPEALEALAWIDEAHLAVAEKADQDPVVGCARSLLVWDLSSLSVVQRIPVPGGLSGVQYVSPGQVAVQVLPDPSPKTLGNRGFWGAMYVWQFMRQHPEMEWPISEMMSRRSSQRLAQVQAAEDPRLLAEEQETWTVQEGPDTFAVDPLQAADQPFGPLCLLDLRDLDDPKWRILLTSFPLGRGAVSPDGHFVAFSVPRSGFPFGHGPLVVYHVASGRWARLARLSWINSPRSRWLPSGDTALLGSYSPGSADANASGVFEVDLQPVLAALEGAVPPGRQARKTE